MPIYEFECKKCNKRFEKLMLISDEKNVECPECHSKNVDKLISAGCFRPQGIPTGAGGFQPPSSDCGGGG